MQMQPHPFFNFIKFFKSNPTFIKAYQSDGVEGAKQTGKSIDDHTTEKHTHRQEGRKEGRRPRNPTEKQI